MVLDYGGVPCGGGCSGHGHFEGLAAGSVADEAAVRRYGEGADAARLVEEAIGGDQGALDDLKEIGHRLGAGIATLVNIFNPELVIVGGGFSRARELVQPALLETLAVEALAPGRDLVRVVPAHFGPEAGMIGAALVGFEALDAASS
jgi:glucokinase